MVIRYQLMRRKVARRSMMMLRRSSVLRRSGVQRGPASVVVQRAAGHEVAGVLRLSSAGVSFLAVVILLKEVVL